MDFRSYCMQEWRYFIEIFNKITMLCMKYSAIIVLEVHCNSLNHMAEHFELKSVSLSVVRNTNISHFHLSFFLMSSRFTESRVILFLFLFYDISKISSLLLNLWKKLCLKRSKTPCIVNCKMKLQRKFSIKKIVNSKSFLDGHSFVSLSGFIPKGFLEGALFLFCKQVNNI